MKKQVSSREFFHGFARLHAAMKPGETLVITKHGKPLGEFTKQGAKKAVRLPELKTLGLEPAASLAAREGLYRKLMGEIESESVS